MAADRICRIQKARDAAVFGSPLPLTCCAYFPYAPAVVQQTVAQHLRHAIRAYSISRDSQSHRSTRISIQSQSSESACTSMHTMANQTPGGHQVPRENQEGTLMRYGNELMQEVKPKKHAIQHQTRHNSPASELPISTFVPDTIYKCSPGNVLKENQNENISTTENIIASQSKLSPNMSSSKIADMINTVNHSTESITSQTGPTSTEQSGAEDLQTIYAVNPESNLNCKYKSNLSQICIRQSDDLKDRNEKCFFETESKSLQSAHQPESAQFEALKIYLNISSIDNIVEPLTENCDVNRFAEDLKTTLNSTSVHTNPTKSKSMISSGLKSSNRKSIRSDFDFSGSDSEEPSGKNFKLAVSSMKSNENSTEALIPDAISKVIQSQPKFETTPFSDTEEDLDFCIDEIYDFVKDDITIIK